MRLNLKHKLEGAKRRIAELLWLLPVALGTGRNSIKTGGAVGFSLTSHFSTGHSLGECGSGKDFGGDPGLASTWVPGRGAGTRSAMGLLGPVRGKKCICEGRACVPHLGPWYDRISADVC